jgi:hypothetical protein
MKKNPANDQTQRANEYARIEDFCAIFQHDMRSLYMLALMLTGNAADAEACFVSAFAACQTATRIFKPWAASWSRLSVVDRAMHANRPRIAHKMELLAERDETHSLPAELAAVLRLDDFRRFVYVLTVLEKYSIRDAAILLKHGVRDVALAQRQSIELLGKAMMPVGSFLPESLPASLTA